MPDSPTSLIRWAGMTTGVDLSQLVYRSDYVLIIGENKEMSSVNATYEFDPAQLPVHLLPKFPMATHLCLLNGYGGESVEDTFHPVPGWLAPLTKLQSLALWNADVSDLSMIRDLPITYFDLRYARYKDQEALIEAIRGLKKLELFISDESISEDVEATLRKRLPNVQFVRKRR